MADDRSSGGISAEDVKPAGEASETASAADDGVGAIMGLLSYIETELQDKDIWRTARIVATARLVLELEAGRGG